MVLLVLCVVYHVDNNIFQLEEIFRKRAEKKIKVILFEDVQKVL